MKVKLITAMTMLLVVAVFARCDKDDDNIDPKDLPVAARTFINKHYPNKNYTAERDIENGKIVYEVDLSGGVELGFDTSGKCIYVEGRRTKVPDEVIDSKIQTYVNSNYPNTIITEWELESTYQEVELSNNVELIFNLQGNFSYDRGGGNFSDDDDSIVSPTELPSAAKTFISTHFPNVTITGVVKETEPLEIEYDVILSNGFNLDFDATGRCVKIDGNNQEIPDTALDSKIVSYVTVNYSSNFITQWDLDSRNQDIELNNDTDLIFDLNGNFIYADN